MIINVFSSAVLHIYKLLILAIICISVQLIHKDNIIIGSHMTKQGTFLLRLHEEILCTGLKINMPVWT